MLTIVYHHADVMLSAGVTMHDKRGDEHGIQVAIGRHLVDIYFKNPVTLLRRD